MKAGQVNTPLDGANVVLRNRPAAERGRHQTDSSCYGLNHIGTRTARATALLRLTERMHLPVLKSFPSCPTADRKDSLTGR